MEKARSVDRVSEVLAGFGMDGRVRELPDRMRTAAEAGAALGCEVGEIVRSLVFHLPERDPAVLVLASGSDRVEQATGSFVRERTGFAIGGVSPVGLTAPVLTCSGRRRRSWSTRRVRRS